MATPTRPMAPMAMPAIAPLDRAEAGDVWEANEGFGEERSDVVGLMDMVGRSVSCPLVVAEAEEAEGVGVGDGVAVSKFATLLIESPARGLTLAALLHVSFLDTGWPWVNFLPGIARDVPHSAIVSTPHRWN
jgi:hypothetical protein